VVSLVGRNIRAILHQLGPALQVFNEKRMYLVSQAASDLNLTVVVDEDEVDRLATEVHRLCVGQRIADPNLGPSWQQLVRGSEEEPVEAVAGSWWAGRREELLGLARERATPMFVYDAATLAESVADLRSLSAVTQVFYAVKANYNEGILRLFHDAGLGFECVSPGELELLVSLFPGMSPERLLFTPNFAPRGEYARALEMGVRVTLDNLHPLRAWPELFAGREILVRLDPGTGRGHHRHVHTAGEHSKFGVPPDDLDELRTLVREAGARVVGLHAHTGSGILTPENWKENARFLAGVAQSFPDVRALDLGGGLGIPERPGQERLDLGEVARSLAQVAAACPQYELWLEPGRFLVGRAGVILTRVTQVKRKGPHVYLGVDVGMNTLIRPALYGAYHHIVNLTRAGMPLSERATIVGPICESGDVLGDGRAMPRTEEGDVLLIGTAGAYGRSMSSSYNLREPAAEVFLA
jgi:diaminopimelate decarboxylase/aspartate kinase